MRDYYGFIRVKALVKLHYGHYVLIFAKDRLIAAMLGKSELQEDQGAMAGAFFGGITGAIIGSKLDERTRRKRKEKARKWVELTTKEILEMKKENFEIPYSEIERVVMYVREGNNKGGRIEIFGKGVTPALVKCVGYRLTTGLFRKKPVKNPRTDIGFDIIPDQDCEECKTIASMALQSKLETN